MFDVLHRLHPVKYSSHNPCLAQSIKQIYKIISIQDLFLYEAYISVVSYIKYSGFFMIYCTMNSLTNCLLDSGTCHEEDLCVYCHHSAFNYAQKFKKILRLDLSCSYDQTLCQHRKNFEINRNKNYIRSVTYTYTCYTHMFYNIILMGKQTKRQC